MDAVQYDEGGNLPTLADAMYPIGDAGFHGAEGLTVLKHVAEGTRYIRETYGDADE